VTDFLKMLCLYLIIKFNIKKTDYLYCDDDVINELGLYERPHFKTDFNCDLLHSNNYIGDFLLLKNQYL
jgi:hypothetical protein